MKKALTVSLLALLISQGAAAAEYTLNNASMALLIVHRSLLIPFLYCPINLS